jgi:hypothetical protein
MTNVQFVNEYKDKKQREEEDKWLTGLVIMQTQEGNVYIDNSISHFNNKTKRQATENDAIYMLSQALQEFEMEKQASIMLRVIQEINQENAENKDK